MAMITLEEAQRRLPELIASAILGEEVVITRQDQSAVKLVPVESRPAQTGPKFGSAKGSILFMADDFDAPLEEFKEYME